MPCVLPLRRWPRYLHSSLDVHKLTPSFHNRGTTAAYNFLLVIKVISVFLSPVSCLQQSASTILSHHCKGRRKESGAENSEGMNFSTDGGSGMGATSGRLLVIYLPALCQVNSMESLIFDNKLTVYETRSRSPLYGRITAFPSEHCGNPLKAANRGTLQKP